MKAVLHFPVAWQYPSRIDTTSALASNLISGISGHLSLYLDVTSSTQRFGERRAKLCDGDFAVRLAFDGERERVGHIAMSVCNISDEYSRAANCFC